MAFILKLFQVLIKTQKLKFNNLKDISMKKILIVSCTFILFSFSLNAQEKWSLEKCIDYAIENNITIKQSNLNTQTAKENLFQSKASLLPNANAYVNHTLNGSNAPSNSTFGYTNEGFYEGNAGLYSELNLFNGFRNINTILKNKKLYEAATQSEENYKNELALSIINMYMQILYNTEFKEIASVQLDIIKDQIKKTESLVTAGTTTKSELLKLQYQEASEQVTMTQVENELDNSYLLLAQFLELPSNQEENFEIEKYENLMPVDTTNWIPGNLYKVSEGIMPQIKAKKYEIESYDKDIRIASSGLYPQLSLSYNYTSWYNETYDPDPLSPPSSYSIQDQLSDHNYGQLGLSIEIPIFNNFLVKNNRSLAKIRKINAEYELENEKKELYKDIQTAYNNMKSARESYNMQEKALSYAKESFRYARQQMEAGVISALDFNMEKNTLIKAESEFLQAKYQYIFSLKLLDFYAGNKIR
jgi:outer membrane protein